MAVLVLGLGLGVCAAAMPLDAETQQLGPVEQPTKVKFIINLKTAEALGLTIPQSLFLRVEEIIQ